MDLLTIVVLMILSFALAVAGAKSVLELVLRFMEQDEAPIPVTVTNPGSSS